VRAALQPQEKEAVDASLWVAHPDFPALILGLVLALGICWPLVGGGRVFLLDWVTGPHNALLPSTFYGLNGGLMSGLPLVLVVGHLTHLVGSVGTWIPIAAFFPIATVSMGRLVGGRQWARLGAATLFAVNPFVFQRLYAGHIALLLGYALLPLVVRSMVRAVDNRGVARLTPVLWMALLTGNVRIREVPAPNGLPRAPESSRRIETPTKDRLRPMYDRIFRNITVDGIAAIPVDPLAECRAKASWSDR
jgi:hypothetical protein